ncbi:DEAD/DEAH box helicase [Chryseobacterium indoltheticum]|uniref:DEAD/DEAH box helicase n=1 Tax=Chryseobacterium indoltheticum TaxID=254 RepID=A0A3G6N749_9FLAO|nr:DEAD/DEAH box helicase [Chryseobacterium indoltheticum]AZA60813.1 DEAD/DEAH box helicase [Chryseobacterium indoltheticum]
MSIAEIVKSNAPDLFSIVEKPKFTLRPYQQEAVDAGVSFFNSNSKKNTILILPTGAGKSVVIAHILAPLSGKTIILQPSKEILEQNFAKYISSGYKASVYSASAGQKRVDRITFCTIGSIINKKHLFEGVEHIIIDECHLVNSKGGMYDEFLSAFPKAKVLGLTATPYRLTNDSFGAQLKFLNRTKPRIFSDILYYVQNNELFDNGYLSKLEYFSFNVVDRSMLQLNSTGTDYTEQSLRRYYKIIDMPSVIVKYSLRLLKKKPNLLIFCSLIEEAEAVTRRIPGAVILTGATKKEDRERILSQFKSGKIKCVVNVGVLTTGFDYPELECVLIARSTMSLALYYQIVGRAMRISPKKENAWIVDLGGNISFFGKIETMKIEQTSTGLFFISNNGRQLTNVPFQK